MIVVFDVGNTETTIGLFEGERLVSRWRLTTDASRTPDELGMWIREALRGEGVDPGAVSGVAIGSVVPPLTDPLVEACGRWLRKTPIVVDARSPLPIRLDVEEPLTVGADRVLNTLAASRIFARDVIVVDLGTATTFDCITADGVFLGGVIAPGVRTSADTLVRRTAKLPATDLVAPTQVIGRRTEECIRAGVMFGTADAIDGLVGRIKSAWPRSDVPLVVATGGLATLFEPLWRTVDRIEPFLTLRGLQIAYDLLSRQ